MTRTAIHPGEHLAENLKALDMSAAELSRTLRVPANRIAEILNGRRAVTGDTALRLGHFFHTSPEFWLNVQSIYDLRVAAKKSGDAIKSLPTLRRGGKRNREGEHLQPA
jgi:addiction module HigA family antidote